MATKEMSAIATKALRGSVKLSNEIVGTMNLMEMGIPMTPGIIRAMRKYLADVEAYVEMVSQPSTRPYINHDNKKTSDM